MKWTILIILIFIMPIVMADQGEIEVYKPREVFDLSIHLSNNTGVVTGATCQAEIRNSNYDVIHNVTLNEIDGGWYNATYNQSKIGKYFCRQNCTMGKLFVAETCDFVIAGEEDMPIAVILVVLFVIIVYFFLLINLFTARQFTEHGLIKLLFLMIAFWVLLLPVNMAIQYNDANGGPVAVTTYLELLYQIMIWLNSFIIVYFMLWFIVQMLKKIGEGRRLKEMGE